MFAMRRAESVVHINIAELGQLLGEVRVVLFFFLMKAKIFQQEDFAVFELFPPLFGVRADAVVSEFHVRAGQFFQLRGHWFERIFRLRPAFGAAKVRTSK